MAFPEYAQGATGIGADTLLEALRRRYQEAQDSQANLGPQFTHPLIELMRGNLPGGTPQGDYSAVMSPEVHDLTEKALALGAMGTGGGGFDHIPPANSPMSTAAGPIGKAPVMPPDKWAALLRRADTDAREMFPSNTKMQLQPNAQKFYDDMHYLLGDDLLKMRESDFNRHTLAGWMNTPGSEYEAANQTAEQGRLFNAWNAPPANDPMPPEPPPPAVDPVIHALVNEGANESMDPFTLRGLSDWRSAGTDQAFRTILANKRFDQLDPTVQQAMQAFYKNTGIRPPPELGGEATLEMREVPPPPAQVDWNSLVEKLRREGDAKRIDWNATVDQLGRQGKVDTNALVSGLPTREERLSELFDILHNPRDTSSPTEWMDLPFDEWLVKQRFSNKIADPPPGLFGNLREPQGRLQRLQDQDRLKDILRQPRRGPKNAPPEE